MTSKVYKKKNFGAKFVRRGVAVLLLSVMLFASSSCGKQPRRYTFYGTFDTVGTLTDYGGMRGEAFAALCAEAEAEFLRYHRLFDIYHEYDGLTNLATLNRLAGGEPIAVSDELMAFLSFCLRIYDETDGLTNVLLGAVTSLYRSATDALPSEEVLLAAGAHSSPDLLELDAAAGTARLTDPLASLDVGAVGKGYAIARVAEFLRERGVSHFLINLGGNLCAVGDKPDGSPFTAGVRNPLAPDAGAYAAVLPLTDTSCATSGSYERYFTVGGKRYSHILDPRTLAPAEGIASVTVITGDSGMADALSTALYCLTVEEGKTLLATFADVRVLWILPDGSQVSYPD